MKLKSPKTKLQQSVIKMLTENKKRDKFKKEALSFLVMMIPSKIAS